jgi:hypothetical protein
MWLCGVPLFSQTDLRGQNFLRQFFVNKLYRDLQKDPDQICKNEERKTDLKIFFHFQKKFRKKMIWEYCWAIFQIG